MTPLPIFVIKFDRSLVATTANSLESATIDHPMMQLDEVPGFRALAGGLEGNDALQRPPVDGVDLGYGLLFARPMTDDAILSAPARQRVVQRR